MLRHGWILGVALAAFGCSSENNNNPPADTGTGNDVVTDATMDSTPPMDAPPDTGTAPVDASPEVLNDPAWLCLGHVPATTSPAPTVTLTIRAVNNATSMPISGATIKACARTDNECTTPLSMGTSGMTGAVSLMVPTGTTGFDGYFETTGMNLVPTRTFIFPRPTSASTGFDLTIVPTSQFNLLTLAIGVTPDATRGHLAGKVLNCMGNAASGASIAISPAPMGAQRYYFDGILPSVSATETDSSGVAGSVNVTPGTYMVTATRVATATRIGTVELAVRAGYITAFTLPPTP